MLAWFDVTVTKPPLQLGLKLGEHVVYLKLFHPSPIIVLRVDLSRGPAIGMPLKQYYIFVHPCPWPCPFGVVGVWCFTKLLKRHCQIHL